MRVVFSGLSPLVIESVERQEFVVRVRARTPSVPVPCPVCDVLAWKIHSYHRRRLADLAVDDCPVVVDLTVRRLYCSNGSCPRKTFREQAPGVAERYQRRTPRLSGKVKAVVHQLAGRAASRLLKVLRVNLSLHTCLRILLGIELPQVATPRILGVDDFALRRSHVYATILIDAATRQRVDVLPDRKADTLEAWLRAHPGVEIVCRDSSGAYAEAIRRALPDAIQVTDRWHIWHNLAEAVRKEVADHSACWSKGGPVQKATARTETTLGRWRAVHELLDKGVGLMEICRRLQLGLNAVKRYARTSEPDRLRRAPQYRPTLVDPFREYLQKRRAADPAVPVMHLLKEIKALGYKGSQNLLYRYITQGRVEADRRPVSTRKATGVLMSNPANLHNRHQELLERLSTACPEMTAIAGHIRDFAALLKPDPGNAKLLHEWITAVRAADLPHLHSFTRGLDLDNDAVEAALTLPFHNGGCEGVNTKTKLIKRQMYGRATFGLLRHRILLS